MTNLSHHDALLVLSNAASHDREKLFEALYSIRQGMQASDVGILRRLLDHDDADIVASTLSTLWYAYGVTSELMPFILAKVWGDDRDCMEMPIQTQAIVLLGEVARHDKTSFDKLVAVAENVTASDIPRKRAWQSLAGIIGFAWQPEYSQEMILTPNSEQSERIREQIRSAILSSKS